MPIEERRKVIFSLQSVLDVLPIEKKEKSYYLSQFTVSIAAGLFKGALNFLWNETVEALRKLVISYDLQYFYSIAEEISGRYKNLAGEDDLEIVSEFDLLEICRRIGLLSDVNHKNLEHVNYLRNHASVAHPNDNEITGFKMVSILEDCIKYAINAKPNHSVIQIKSLFNNIRKNEIPEEKFSVIGDELSKQPQERINDFIMSVFGLYCDSRQEQHTYSNIENLASYIWELASEDTKYKIVSRYGMYRKNAEVEKRDKSQRFLEVVNGLRYKDEDSLAAELIEKLQDLRSTHFGGNNFYNEYSHAKDIANSLPKSGILKAVRKQFVKVIGLCYIGNGLGHRKGVDERALKYYRQFIDKFKANKRAKKLAKKSKSITSDIHINNILDLVISFPENKLKKISEDSRYKELLSNIK
jgi:hypothetical protein